MIERSRWFRAAIILIALAAAVYLFQAASRLWGYMGDLILILFFGWLMGSVLLHFINTLMRVPHMRRPIAIVIVYFGLIVIAGTLIFLILPATVNQTLELFDQLPTYLDQLPEWAARADEFAAGFGFAMDPPLAERLEAGNVEDFFQPVRSWLTDNAVPLLQTLGTTIFAVGTVIVLSFYVVLDGGRRLNEALSVLPPKAEAEARLVLSTFSGTFNGYIRGMFIVSLIYGVGVATVMLATGLPAALPSAVLASLLLAVPFIGDWLALALPLIVAAIAGDFITLIIVLATLLFLQQVMLNLLTPRILGQALRVPAGLVIVSVIVGARVAGIPGALLGVPAGAVIYSLAVVYGSRIRERRQQSEQAAAEMGMEPQQGAPGAAGGEPRSATGFLRSTRFRRRRYLGAASEGAGVPAVPEPEEDGGAEAPEKPRTADDPEAAG